MYDSRLTRVRGGRLSENSEKWVPLAAVAALREEAPEPALPIAYVPRIPEGRSFREMIERGVAWSRR